MPLRFQLRHGTAADWATANPILAVAELGYETDTNKVKFGDGATAWNSLSYFSATASGVVPIGGIIMWSGLISIPVNWALCDGTNGTPDLRDKFIV